MRRRLLIVVILSASIALPLAVACSGGESAPAMDASTGTTSDAALADSSTGEPVAPGPPDLRILPLALGRRWAYAARALDGGAPTTCVGVQTAEVLGPGAEHDAGPSLRYHPLCLTGNGAENVDVVGTGDRLIAYVLNDAGAPIRAPVLYLDAPVEEGHSWQYSAGLRFVWHSAGTVTVPAGTFPDCWRRDELVNDGGVPGAPGYVVYCRGVGQVQHIFADYVAELTTKNF